MEKFGYMQNELLKKTRIPPGTKLKILKRDIEGREIGTRVVKVVEEYRHNVLLDFGDYKESRRKVDIALGICDVII